MTFLRSWFAEPKTFKGVLVRFLWRLAMMLAATVLVVIFVGGYTAVGTLIAIVAAP